MKTRLTPEQKVEALTNALRSFRFHEKYFIHAVNPPNNRKFAIATKEDYGAINQHTEYMSYEELNKFMLGYHRAKQNKFT